MPRPRKNPAAELEDISLPGLDNIPHDPEPKAERRGPGRPRGSKAAPAKKILARTPTGRTMSAEQMKSKVHAELYGIAAMLVGVWEMKDPECAGMFTEPVGNGQDRLEAIVAQTVEILARNKSLLATLASAGLITQVGLLAGLMMPAVKQIWKAHGPGGHGHRDEQEIDYGQYPAPALAGV